MLPPYQAKVHRNLKVEERRGFALMEGYQPVPYHPIWGMKLDDRTKDTPSTLLTKDEQENIQIWLRDHATPLNRIKIKLGKSDRSNEDVLNEYESIQEELYFGGSLPVHLTKRDFQ